MSKLETIKNSSVMEINTGGSFLSRFGRILVLVLITLSVVTLYGCQQQPAQVSQGDALFVSEKGVKMDALFPEKFFLLAKVGTDNDGQIKNLKNLLNYFPKDSSEKLSQAFVSTLEKLFQESTTGLSSLSSEEISPLISEKSQLVVTLSQSEEKKEKASSPSSSETAEVNSNSENKLAEAVSGQNPPQVILAVSLKDEAAVDKIFSKLEGGEPFNKKDAHNNLPYLVNDHGLHPLYLSKYKDVLILANNLEQLKLSLDNVVSGKVVDRKNDELYQKVLSSYEPNVGFFYVEAKDQYLSFVNNLTNSLFLGYQFDSGDGLNPYKSFQESMKKMQDTLGMNLLEGGSYLFTVENEGVRVHLRSLGKGFLTKSDSMYSKLLQGLESSYLYKKIPGGNPWMYFEANNLKQIWDLEVQLLSGLDPKFAEGYEEFKKIIAAENIDLEKDLLTFLDKALVFSFDNNGSLFPGMVIAVDASSNSEGAKKIMDKFNGLVDLGIQQAEAQSPQAKGVFVKEQNNKDGNAVWSVKLDMKKLFSSSLGVPEQIMNQKIELYYGVNSDKLAFIAFTPDFMDKYGKDTIGQAEEFRKALDYIKGYDVNVLYVSPAETFAYIDGIFAFAKKAGSPQASADLAQYEMVKPYFTPLKSLIFAATKPTDTEIHYQMFLHIAQ